MQFHLIFLHICDECHGFIFGQTMSLRARPSGSGETALQHVEIVFQFALQIYLAFGFCHKVSEILVLT